MRSRYVLLGDVVDSREIEDRVEFRTALESGCAAVRETYGGDFEAGPDVLKGIDELGAVLTSIEHVYDIVVTLSDHLHPHRIRVAVSTGNVAFARDESDVSSMDGEAFHRASELLETVEAMGLRFDMQTDRGPIDTAVADEINLLLHRRDSWTDRQREVIDRYERTGNQRSVAGELDVSQQAISNVLQGASWPLVETIQDRLRRTLAEVSE